MSFIDSLIILTLASGLISCSHSPHSIKSEAHNSTETKRYLYLKSDSICIAIEKKVFCIPKNSSIDYKNSYPGIYEIKKDSIKKSYGLVLNNLVYFTTYDDVGMGYRGNLYVFDTKIRKLIYDRDFKRNYLYSNAAIFIIDRSTNKIFSVGKFAWYDKKNTGITPASMYSINGDNFIFLKNVYEDGEKTEDGTSLMKFYNRSLASNAKHGVILPENWWKFN